MFVPCGFFLFLLYAILGALSNKLPMKNVEINVVTFQNLFFSAKQHHSAF